MRNSTRWIVLGLALAAASLAGCVRADVNVRAPDSINIGNWTGYGRSDAVDQGVLFVGYDSLAVAGRPVALVAQVIDPKTGQGIEGLEIGFYEGRKKLGSDTTNANGLASLDWLAPRTGNFSLAAKVDSVPDTIRQQVEDVHPVPIRIASIETNAPIAIVDTEDTFFDGGFGKALEGRQAAGGAAAALGSVARGHTIVYAVRRLDALSAKGKAWLADNAMPIAPMLPVTLKHEFADARRLKVADAHSLKRTFHTVRAGITGKRDMAEDFIEEGLRTFLIVHLDDNPDADDLREAADDLRKVTGYRRLNAVDSWRDIGLAFDRNQSFPAPTLAEEYDRRAGRLKERDD